METKTGFPTLSVVILSLCMGMQAYTYVNLFPYAGMMVKELLGLGTTNESGEVLRVPPHASVRC